MTDLDFTAPAPPRTPPKHTGTMCGHMISGGMMSYRCEIIQGHANQPPHDPEPHYAKEVQRSVRAWEDWARRQWEAARAEGAQRPEVEDLPVATAKGAQPPAEPFDCPLPGCDYPFEHNHGTDAPRTETPKTVHEVFTEVPEDGSRPLVLQENAEAIANGELHNPYDEACSKRDFGGVSLPNERCMICRPDTEAPTKQRPEDQVLPDGDESLVDDQQVLIDFIAERRKIGIERYGQAHRPFNGRDTLRDWYEEQVDSLVYMTSMMRSAQATRMDLIKAVTEALTQRANAQDAKQALASDLAVVAVDRIMSWVTGALLRGPEVNFDRIYQVVLDEMGRITPGMTQGDLAVALAKRLSRPEMCTARDCLATEDLKHAGPLGQRCPEHWEEP